MKLIITIMKLDRNIIKSFFLILKKLLKNCTKFNIKIRINSQNEFKYY